MVAEAAAEAYLQSEGVSTPSPGANGEATCKVVTSLTLLIAALLLVETVSSIARSSSQAGSQRGDKAALRTWWKRGLSQKILVS